MGQIVKNGITYGGGGSSSADKISFDSSKCEHTSAKNVQKAIEDLDKNSGSGDLYAKIQVYTEEDAFKGLTVTASGGGETVSAVIDSSGNAMLTIHNFNTAYTVSVVYSGETFDTTVTAPCASVYSVELAMETASLVVSTPDKQLYGKPIKLVNGTTTLTGSFSATGTFTKKIRKLGTYTLSCTDSTISAKVPSVQVSVEAYDNTYNATMRYNWATINVSTSESELLGKVVTLTKSGGSSVTKTFPTSLTDGKATVTFENLDKAIYTISCTSEGGDTAEETFEILNYFTINEVELSLWDGIVYQNNAFAQGYSINGYKQNADGWWDNITTGIRTYQERAGSIVSYIEIPKVGKYKQIQLTASSWTKTDGIARIGYTKVKPTSYAQPQFISYLDGAKNAGTYTIPITSGDDYVYLCCYNSRTATAGANTIILADIRLVK